MRDSRLDKWAQLLVHYSLGIDSSHSVLIQGDIGGIALVEACYKECVKSGAHVEYLINFDGRGR